MLVRNPLHHMFRKSSRDFLMVAICLVLQACVPVIPQNQQDNKKPYYKIPTSYGDASVAKQKGNSQDGFSTADKSWHSFFSDPFLHRLIQVALEHNQELHIFAQEINISNNEFVARRGEYFPKVNVGFQYEVEKVGKYTSQGASDETTEYEPGKYVPKVLRNHRVGFLASWEVDLWHKYRNATKSAYLKYFSTIEDRKFLVTQLVSEIAMRYYELIALDNQLAIIEHFIQTLKQAQYMIEAQKSAGRSTALAVKRFEAEVLKNQSRRYTIKQKIKIDENVLNKLLGRFPQTIVRSNRKLNSLLPKSFYTGLPINLLDNRPDIKSASLQLTASKIDVEVAKARFYPSFNIDLGTGYEAFNSQYFINPESIFYNLANNVVMPLINRNAIKQQYFSANNKQIQAIYNYDQKLLNAYVEVENQLAIIDNIKKITQLRRMQVKALSDSVSISNMLFKAARVDYIEFLLTKRDLLESQLELVDVETEQLVSFVNLYKALGGGWRQVEQQVAKHDAGTLNVGRQRSGKTTK